MLATVACGDTGTDIASRALAGSGGTASTLTIAGASGTAQSAGMAPAMMAGSGGSTAGGAGSAGMIATVSGRGGAAAGQGGQAGLTGGGGAAGTGSTSDAGMPPSGGYRPCPTDGMPCRILPLGDSITFGIGYSGGYRVELFRKAQAAGHDITFTGSQMNGPTMVEGEPFPRRNEGHSGWKIAQLEPLIPNPAFMDEPHIILLMIGTNDIAQNDDLPNAPKRLGELVDLLIEEAPEALIVLAKLTPLSFGRAGVMTYNDALPAIAEARANMGKHLLVVDMFTDFPTSELGDGVHPNQQGYERMAGVWYDAIEDLLE